MRCRGSVEGVCADEYSDQGSCRAGYHHPDHRRGGHHNKQCRLKDFLTTDVGDDRYAAQYEKATARLRVLAATDNMTCAISLLDRNGTVVAATDETIVGSDRSSEDVF